MDIQELNNRKKRLIELIETMNDEELAQLESYLLKSLYGDRMQTTSSYSSIESINNSIKEPEIFYEQEVLLSNEDSETDTMDIPTMESIAEWEKETGLKYPSSPSSPNELQKIIEQSEQEIREGKYMDLEDTFKEINLWLNR